MYRDIDTNRCAMLGATMEEVESFIDVALGYEDIL